MEKTNYVELDFLEEFQKFLTASKKGKRVKKDGSKITKGRQKNLEETYNLLKSFSCQKNFPLRIKTLQKNKRQINSEKIYWKRFYMKFTGYLFNDRDCYDNYVGSVIKDIRAFFNFLIREKNLLVGNFHEQFYVFKEDIQILTLQPYQVQYLMSSESSQNLRPVLLKVKEILLTGCTVALRYSDIMNLKKENFQYYNEQYYLKIQSKKSNIYTSIKLPT